jgi:FixJ family two-component response regulator
MTTVDLSPKQRQVLELMVQGHGNGEIGRLMGISRHTVDKYVDIISDRAFFQLPEEWAGRKERRQQLMDWGRRYLEES